MVGLNENKKWDTEQRESAKKEDTKHKFLKKKCFFLFLLHFGEDNNRSQLYRAHTICTLLSHTPTNVRTFSGISLGQRLKMKGEHRKRPFWMRWKEKNVWQYIALANKSRNCGWPKWNCTTLIDKIVLITMMANNTFVANEWENRKNNNNHSNSQQITFFKYRILGWKIASNQIVNKPQIDRSRVQTHTSCITVIFVR